MGCRDTRHTEKLDSSVEITHRPIELRVLESEHEALFDVVPLPQLHVFAHHSNADMFRNLVCNGDGMGWITYNDLDYAFCSRCLVISAYHQIPTNWVVAAND